MTTLLTRWVRLTGSEWIHRRFTEALNDWLTPEALHHIYCRTPYDDGRGNVITDPAFAYLLRDNPAAAFQQLEHEAVAFRIDQAIRDRKRAEQPPAPQLTHKQHSLL
jgi:hypothetical protein